MHPLAQLSLDKMEHLVEMADNEVNYVVNTILPNARTHAVALLEKGITKSSAIELLSDAVGDSQMHMASLEELKEDITLQLEIALSAAEDGEERQAVAYQGSTMILGFLEVMKSAFDASLAIAQFLNKASES